MTDILVVHDDLMTKGGGEAVCMHTLEALQDQFDVTLLTAGKLNLDELNQYYSTTVSNITVRRNPIAEAILIGIRLIPGPNFGKLTQSVHLRRRKKLFSSYDLVISTKNELHVGCNSIAYIHFPRTGRDQANASRRRNQYPDTFVTFYDSLCEKIIPDRNQNGQTDYVANSEWTAKIATERLDADVSSLYPPVYTDDINPKPWDDREDRILTVGRITPNKRIIRNIEIVSQLRDCGHDIQYDIVGPSGNKKVWQPFLRKVKRQADRHSFITYHGEVPRETLVEMLSRSKYGLHGKDTEHFGIAVAEQVAGGAIPFVPRGGGQREVVGYLEDLMYESVEDAVEKMDRILDDETEQERIRTSLPDVEARFGRQRFQNEIRNLVKTKLGISDSRSDTISQ